MMRNIYYRKSDGEIIGYDNSVVPAQISGYVTLTLDLDTEIFASRQKIVDGELVDKTDAEIAGLRAITPTDVSRAVNIELANSDQYLVPDRPMPDDVREGWAMYRQQLRDLSKGDPRPTADQMMIAFPKRPDGTDPVASLRERQS